MQWAHLRFQEAQRLEAPQWVQLPVARQGAAGVAGGAAIGNIAGKKFFPGECSPCEPYPVGTIGFQGPKAAIRGKDGTRAGTGREHYVLFEVQQNPFTCKCRWQESKKVAAHHYYTQTNLFHTINLNGGKRPPSYP